nr:unnamed protein product [Callosobruchus analis]
MKSSVLNLGFRKFKIVEQHGTILLQFMGPSHESSKIQYHASINTNMSIERMHQTIKYLYLNGKQVRHLDKTINILMKLVKDKLFERLITLNKGKVSSKIKPVWEVPSSSTNEVYLVQKKNLQCDCRLLCTACEACLHSYSCTCVDNSIRWNMCKHIH